MSESDDEMLRVLIDDDIEAKNKKGMTPLHYAVIYRNHGGVYFFIQCGADINAKTCLKRTALHFAISSHQPDQRKRTLPMEGTDPDDMIINMLLAQQNLNLDQKDARGETPLMWAVMEKDVSIVNALLVYGANPNARSKDSVTPLHIALSAEDPSLKIVLLLMMYKASLYCVDKDGNIPLDMLIHYVENTQSYRFGYICMETIALNYKVKKLMKRNLEFDSRLLVYLVNCFDEVMRMRTDFLTNKFTVFDFVMYGMDKQDINVNHTIYVYIPFVLRLLDGLYPIYGFIGIKRMSKSDLCTIFEVISSKGCKQISDAKDFTDAKESNEIPNAKEFNEMPGAKECPKKNLSNIFLKIDICLLSRYLSKLDIFCLTVAFSEGKICDCMQNIRNY